MANTDTLIKELKDKENKLNHMDSDLYYAVTTDKVDALEKMKGRLSVGLQLTPTNNTVLHLASQHGSIKCVGEILRTHDPLLLQTNLRGETALHLAARHGHYDVVVALIDAAKLFVSQPNYLPETTPTTAVMPQNKMKSTEEEENQETLQSTSTDQIMPDQPSVLAATPSSSQKEVITDMPSRLTNLITSTDLEGETALHQAVRYNREKVVRLLVQQDPGHSYPQNKRHETPIYLASIRHYADIISTILDNCKSPTFDGPDGRTALHAAVLATRVSTETFHRSKCVKLLCSKYTNLVEVQDKYGWTAFHFVAYNNLDTIVEDLVDAEDRCEGYKSVGYKLDSEKRLALHLAAHQGAVSVMVKLLKYYPDSWEIVDGMGRNVLHIAVEQKNERVISYILSQGSKICCNLLCQRDTKGNTPLHLMAKLASYVPQLMDHRKVDWQVDWNVTDDNNLTPMDVVHSVKETDTLSHALKVWKIHNGLAIAKVNQFGNYWNAQKNRDLETGDIDRVERHYGELSEEYRKKYKEMVNTQIIVAALIATVALTAGFAVPGNFDGNKGPTQGYPQLLRKAAFKAFMITDTIAVLSSISSLLLYFVSTLSTRTRFVRYIIIHSGWLNIFSIVTMMLTFGTGTYAVLAPSSALAISVCVLSTFLFPLFFFISFFPVFRDFFYYVIDNYRQFRFVLLGSA